jgi:hypothetical protein
VVQSGQQATATYAVVLLQVSNAVGVQPVLVLQGRHVQGCADCVLLVLLQICAVRHP